MCGIVGYCNFMCEDRVQALISMRDSLTHRGPDDEGAYFDDDGRVGLGHRRLAVLDLSSQGHQPMSAHEGAVWVVYNGEIYNFKELREELRTKGHSFNSNSDTEVVSKAYLEWGIDCINRFIGMFAIAIWDKRSETLYLVRDRLGVKPLYYYYKDSRLLFGSELKALMAHPGFPKEIDYGVIPNYLRYGYVPAPRTIFKDTYKLKPGHYLRMHNNEISVIKYWDANDYYLGEPVEGSEDEIAEELEALLIDSFKYRLLSDVPVGVFLSGGIDSSTLTALLQKNTSARLKTFSVGFYDDKYNEADWAKKIADHLGTEHVEYYMSANDCLEVIGDLPELYDEPFGDNSGIPTYILSKLTRQHVTVALSADGGDELFGGYNRYRNLSSLTSTFGRVPRHIRNTAVFGLNSLSADRADGIYQKLNSVVPRIKNFSDKYKKYRNMLCACNEERILDMYQFNINKWEPEDLGILLNDHSDSHYDTYFEDTFTELGDIDFQALMMGIDLRTFLVDDVLTKVDRASMSVSLESREPFLDHRLVEYAVRIPSALKCRKGVSKYILRKILYKHVPQELVDRPKRGFLAPVSDWLKCELYPLLMDHLNEDKVKGDGIFNEKAVSKAVKDFLRGSVSEHKIWYLLMFQMWKERWL